MCVDLDFFLKFGWGGDGFEVYFILVILLLVCKLIYNKFFGGGGKDLDFLIFLVLYMFNYNGC